jgi:hypothetical protein
VESARREIARRCEYERPFQWLTGLDVVNHHTLSDFRIEHREALDELFSQVLAVLSAEGLITLERVMHDGIKVYANAGQSSFCSKERIEKHLEIARQHVVAMGEPCADVPDVRRRKAQERAGRERQQRLALALKRYESIRADSFHLSAGSAAEVANNPFYVTDKMIWRPQSEARVHARRSEVARHLKPR